VQVFWVGRLALPEQGPWWLFPLFAALDLSVPPWSERAGKTYWHPHHIAERYGLFTIIVLGESVLAATTGVQGALAGGGLSAELVVISLAGLVLIFVLWWLYFLEPAGEGLEQHRELSYLWGYGHFGIFASLAAIGAGLEVAVESAGHHLEARPVVIAFAIALPVAIFLVLLWVLHAPIVNRVVISPVATCAAAALLLLMPLAVEAIGLAGVLVAMAAVLVGLLAHTVLTEPRQRPATPARAAA
jgi:low temperature requirement protein LtrA